MAKLDQQARDKLNGAIVEIAWWKNFNGSSTYKATRAARIAGRCTCCWGRLVGSQDEDGRWTSIKCQLCGRSVEGEDALSEMERMRCEKVTNLTKVCQGLAAEYRKDAKFILKILPDMDRDTEYVDKRIAMKIEEGRRSGWMTRHDFPAGTAGYLYLHAGILLMGIEDLPRVESLIPYEDSNFEEPIISGVKVADDGSIHMSGKITAGFQQPLGLELIKRMSLVMMSGTTSAFACELVLKAILLTRLDEAKKTHDLLYLYNNLPEDSRTRLKADFSEIEDVLEQGRHTFGKWRYLDTESGEKAIRTMVDYQKAFKLAKAARVLVDEGEIAGLDGKVEGEVKGNVYIDTGDESYQEEVNLSVTSGECSIAWDLIQKEGWGR